MSKGNPRDQQAIEKLGQNVRKYRILKGLTIVKLSEECDVEYSTISKIERGLINTTISMIVLIAKALTISPSQLLEENFDNNIEDN